MTATAPNGLLCNRALVSGRAPYPNPGRMPPERRSGLRGLLACAAIVVLYAAVAVRVLLRLQEEDDLFTILAAAGLTAQLVGQAFINIMVNLQMFPSKGMTLPLISYGGSSMIALCMGVGFLLAITRRNPYLTRDVARPSLPFAEAVRR